MLETTESTVSTVIEESAVEKGMVFIKSIGLEEFGKFCKLGNLFQMIAINGMTLYKQINNLMSDKIFHEITTRRESAVSSYKLAQKCIEDACYQKALHHLEKALEEYSAHKQYKDTIKDEALRADMYFYKAICHFFLEKNNSSIECLQKSISYEKSNILAFNFLAFIYMNCKDVASLDKAKRYLEESIKWESKQIFANYYVAKLNNNFESMKEAVDELINAFDVEDNISNAQQHGNEFKRNLEATTLAFFLPFLITDWLTVLAENVTDVEMLCRIANFCAELIAKTQKKIQSTILNKVSIVVHESRIKALNKIAAIKKESSKFEHFDDDLLQVYSLSSSDGKRFVDYPTQWLDYSITKFFSHGFDLKYIKENFSDQVTNMIAEWAKLSWLAQDTDHRIKKICGLVKEINRSRIDLANLENKRQVLKIAANDNGITAKKAKGIRLSLDTSEASLLESCSKEDVIDYFLDRYFNEKGWNHWFKIAAIRDENKEILSLQSLLHLAAKYHKIDLKIYTKKDKTLIASTQSQVSELNEGAIHLLLNETKAEFSLLQEVNTPYKLYRTLAILSCRDLLEVDSKNELAQQILNKRLVASIPLEAKNYLFKESSWAANTSSTYTMYRRLFEFTHPQGNKHNKWQYETIKAKLMLAIAHCQRQPVNEDLKYDLASELQEVINANVLPFSDWAKVFRARLVFRYVPFDQEIVKEATSLLQEETNNLISFEAKLFHKLLLAEYKIRRSFDGASEKTWKDLTIKAKDYINDYLKLIGIDMASKDPCYKLLKDKIESAKNSPLLAYCLGYAASLISLINNEEAEEYRFICMQLGFISSDDKPVTIKEKLGFPQFVCFTKDQLSLENASYGLANIIHFAANAHKTPTNLRMELILLAKKEAEIVQHEIKIVQETLDLHPETVLQKLQSIAEKMSGSAAESQVLNSPNRQKEEEAQANSCRIL